MPNVVVEVTVLPLGTANTSMAAYVAAAARLLKEYPDILYQVNPMSTTLSGELGRVLDLVRRMHEAPFTQGACRVSTSLRIDDRRDGSESMQERVETVRELARV